MNKNPKPNKTKNQPTLEIVYLITLPSHEEKQMESTFLYLSVLELPAGSFNNSSIIVKPTHITTAIFKGPEERALPPFLKIKKRENNISFVLTSNCQLKGNFSLLANVTCSFKKTVQPSNFWVCEVCIWYFMAVISQACFFTAKRKYLMYLVAMEICATSQSCLDQTHIPH